MKQPITYVTIQTTSFSGATLLAFLLGAHPQIATIGELDGLLNVVDFEGYLCSCGQKITQCDFWQSVKEGMHTRGYEFDITHFDTKFELDGARLYRYLRRGSTRNNSLDWMRDTAFQLWPPERRRLKTLVARNEALIETILDLTGKDTFVDSSKGRLRFPSIRKFSKFNIRVIYLVRDVKGVVASNLRRDNTVDVQKVAEKWVKLHQRHQRVLATLPEDSRIMVRYEDLCEDVQGTLAKIFRFCEVDPEVQLKDFRLVSHHIIGNRMRLNAQSEIKLDQRWKRMLTKEQLQAIDAVAGPLCRRYGY